MVRTLLFTLMLCFGLSAVSLAQLSEETLVARAQEKSQKYGMLLSLSPTKIKQLEDIFHEYDHKLEFETYSMRDFMTIAKKYEEERDAEIKALLGARKFKSYQAYEQIKVNEQKEYFAEINNMVESDSAFMHEYYTYSITKMLPKLSEMHGQLTSQMSPRDQTLLKITQDSMYHFLDSLTTYYDKDIAGAVADMRSERMNNGVQPDSGRDLLNVNGLALKYDEQYEKMSPMIADQYDIWYDDITQMLQKHFVDNYLETMMKQYVETQKYGLSNVMDKFEFFMLTPYNSERFVELGLLGLFLRRNMMINTRN